MDKDLFLQAVSDNEVDFDKVSKIQEIYGFTLTEEIEKLVSKCGESVFISEECRLLALSEILNANEELHVNFVLQKILPLFDCFDNDFIVWHYDIQKWSLYNIIDQISFNYKTELTELL